jgi:sialate O-acetylesterase
VTSDQVGAIIEDGPADWQIFQQDSRGVGVVGLRGRWVRDAADSGPGAVSVRVLHEATGSPVSSALDWRPADTRDDQTWAIELEIPAGGLYRIETRYAAIGNLAPEWSTRGDMRHFVGVGDLWVIAGQSNSAGYGRGAIDDAPVLGVHVLRNSEQWALAIHPLNESTDTRHTANREGGNSGHSPYLQVGRRLQSALGYPIGLIQTALGGSALAPWNPTEGEPTPLFDTMVHCIDLAGGQIRGIFWYQGESDAQDLLAETYAERFQAAVGAWRAAVDDPALAVLTVQLNRVNNPPNDVDDLNWAIVREAQRLAPHLLDGVVVVPALDLPLSDPIHTSPAGNLVLAERLAQAVLGAVHGHRIGYLAPDISSARQSGDRTVVLSFANVVSRIDTIDLTGRPFLVEDSGGSVPVLETTYPGDATAVLTLGRTLVGAARVHGGYGAAPSPVPLDIERSMPMLGFYGFHVETTSSV